MKCSSSEDRRSTLERSNPPRNYEHAPLLADRFESDVHLLRGGPRRPFAHLRSGLLAGPAQMTLMTTAPAACSFAFALRSCKTGWALNHFPRKSDNETKTQTMRTKQLHYFITALCALSSFVATCGAATPPYSENFNAYVTGDTPVTNFTEVSTFDWTIVSSFSGNAYQNAISATVPGIGFAAGTASSAEIDFPSLATSAFTISTSFRIDTLTATSVDPSGNAFIGLVARAADGTVASSSADRYQVSYYLDGATGIPAGKLYLTERNLFFGDGLGGALSTGTLPIVLGDIYTLTLTGTPSGGSLAVSATLTDTTSSSSITVAATDSANILTGSFFGYLDAVRVQDGGTTAINVDFDNFSAAVPEPTTVVLFMLGCAALAARRLRRIGRSVLIRLAPKSSMQPLRVAPSLRSGYHR